MARLARTVQTALEELDRPWSLHEIESSFLRRARVVLHALPESCLEPIVRVVTALAQRNEDCVLPVGYGGACVRHFSRRSDQLEAVLRVSVERRFALIELTSLASIAGGWAGGPPPRRTQANYKQYLDHVAQLPETASAECEHWRMIVAFLLAGSAPIVVRNISYALVWCGYFTADEAPTDRQLARQFFAADREIFVRGRIEALRWLPKLLEFSLRPSSRGAP